MFSCIAWWFFDKNELNYQLYSCFVGSFKKFSAISWIAPFVGVEGKFFGGAKDFRPNFPKLARKVFVWLMPKTFLPQIRWRPFWYDLQIKAFLYFSAIVKRHFALIFRDFAWIFDKSKLLGVRLQLCTPTSYTTGPVDLRVKTTPAARSMTRMSCGPTTRTTVFIWWKRTQGLMHAFDFSRRSISCCRPAQCLWSWADSCSSTPTKFISNSWGC